MTLSIEVKGVEELIAKFTRLEQFNRVRSRISQEGVFLQRKLRQYPKKVYSPNPLIKSDPRVRRGFFYHLKNKDISVPYRRTRALAQHWAVASSLGGWSVTVGNNMPYAELVQGAEQAKRHQWSGWLTDKGAINVYGPGIKQRIIEAVEKEVKDVG